jgi:hypothetical protein
MFKKKTPKLSETSPFDWKKEDRPSIFAQDPRFTGRYKVPTPVPVTYKNVTWKI